MTKCSIVAYPNSAINTGHGRRNDKSRRMRTYVYICVCACVFEECVMHGQILIPTHSPAHTLSALRQKHLRAPLSHTIFRSLALSEYLCGGGAHTPRQPQDCLTHPRCLRLPAMPNHYTSTVCPLLQHYPLPLSGIQRERERERERERATEQPYIVKVLGR